MKIFRSRGALQKWRLALTPKIRVGFVPTMGALHAGHRSLMTAARQECDLVAVSIFVNPTQFGPQEDLARYPRTLTEDLAMCQAEGVDFVWYPPSDSMYPAGYSTWVTVEPSI